MRLRRQPDLTQHDDFDYPFLLQSPHWQLHNLALSGGRPWASQRLSEYNRAVEEIARRRHCFYPLLSDLRDFGEWSQLVSLQPLPYSQLRHVMDPDTTGL